MMEPVFVEPIHSSLEINNKISQAMFHQINFPALFDIVKSNFKLGSHVHGIGHWERVAVNGMVLAGDCGAPLWFPFLFGMFHDCCREDDGADPDHGPRAAKFLRTLHGDYFHVGQHDLDLLCSACEGHTHVRYHADPWVQCCWDADRLDIGRCGKTPDVLWLGTRLAQEEHIRRWALKQARGRARYKIFDEGVVKRLALKNRKANHILPLYCP